jgi:branched-chain amino acid transport system substrate-binding protein
MAGKPHLKIGYAAPLSGDQAIVGIPMSQCAELAVARANEEPDSPFTLALEKVDDGADPARARQVARRFIEDPEVIGVVGHKNSGPSLAASPLYAEAGLVQITPSSTNTRLSQQGYRTFFRLCAHDAIQGQVAARYAVRVLGARRVAVVHDRTDYGRPLADTVQQTVQEEGADVVLFEGITEGAQDLSDTVERLQQCAPQLIYFALTEIESSILARQLSAAGVEVDRFGTDGSKESQFVPLAGPAAEGTYQTYAGVDPASTPSARAFVQQFTERYGPVPVYGTEVYDATNLLIRALTQAGTPTRQAVARALQEMGEVQGASGPISFDVNGDRRDPQVSIWRVENGDIHLLGLARELIPETA